MSVDIREDWEKELDETGEIKVDGGNGFARSFDLLIEQPLFLANEKMINEKTGLPVVQFVLEGVAVVPKNGKDYSDGYDYSSDDGAKKVNLSIGSLWEVDQDGLAVTGTDPKTGLVLDTFWGTSGYGLMLKKLKAREFGGGRLFFFGLHVQKRNKDMRQAENWKGCIVRIGPESYKGMNNEIKVRDRVVGVVGWEGGIKFPKPTADVEVPTSEEIMEEFNDPTLGKKRELDRVNKMKLADKALADQIMKSGGAPAPTNQIRPGAGAGANGNGAGTKPATAPAKAPAAAQKAVAPAGPTKPTPAKPAAPVAAQATQAAAPVSATVAVATKITKFSPDVEARLLELAASAESHGQFKSAFVESELSSNAELLGWIIMAANYEALRAAC